MMEYRNVGILGFKGYVFHLFDLFFEIHYSIFPSFHYSSSLLRRFLFLNRQNSVFGTNLRAHRTAGAHIRINAYFFVPDVERRTGQPVDTVPMILAFFSDAKGFALR